jgi:protein-tyrosine phosphatase
VSRPAGDGQRFNVLYVCTGNICRSAFAEVLSRQLLADRLGSGAPAPIVFSSAGLRAVTGSGMHPYTRDALALWGPAVYDAAEHFVARPLRPHMVRWADLVLTAEDEQRPQIAWSAPDVVPRLFTMRRFGRIAAALDPLELPCCPIERARALVVAADGSAEATSSTLDSVPDPIGRSPRRHLEAADLIVEAVGALVDAVAPPR